MIVDRDIACAAVEARRLDPRDEILARYTLNLRRDVGERFTAVTADLHVPVVGSDPDDAASCRRFGDRRDRSEHQRAVVVGGDRYVRRDPHDRPRESPDVLREVAGHRPRVAAVRGLEETLGSRIHDARIVRRQSQRRVPVEPERRSSRRLGHDVAGLRLLLAKSSGSCRSLRLPLCSRRRLGRRWLTLTSRLTGRRRWLILASGIRVAAAWGRLACLGRVGRGRRLTTRTRPRPDTDAAARLQVEPVHVSVLRFGVHDRPVHRIVHRVETVAPSHTVPIRIGAALAARGTRSTPAPVVLQPAVHVIRLPHVGADGVELPDRHDVVIVERLGLVVADIEPAVVPEQQVTAVAGVDPQGVMVAVAHAADDAERLAAVHGLIEGGTHRIDDLIVRRIDPDLAVVHRAVVVVAHDPPRLPAIIRTPDTALLRIRRAVLLLLLLTRAASAAASARPRLRIAGFAARVADAGTRAWAWADFNLGVDDVRLRP